jgi:hypothetical protein
MRRKAEKQRTRPAGKSGEAKKEVKVEKLKSREAENQKSTGKKKKEKNLQKK